jgi:hypothetical protein
VIVAVGILPVIYITRGAEIGITQDRKPASAADLKFL